MILLARNRSAVSDHPNIFLFRYISSYQTNIDTVLEYAWIPISYIDSSMGYMEPEADGTLKAFARKPHNDRTIRMDEPNVMKKFQIRRSTLQTLVESTQSAA